MKVKVLTSQSFLENLTKKFNNKKSSHLDLRRFRNFQSVFGKDNYGFILAGDLQTELRTGKKAPVYSFNDELYPVLSSDKSVRSQLFLPSAFSTSIDRFPSASEVEEILDYLEFHQSKKNITHIVNSKKGTISEDKISSTYLDQIGINTIPTYNFSNFSDLQNFMKKRQGEYVFKHRFGERGENCFLINPNNIDFLNDLNIEDYILQDKIDIVSEKRLILLDGTLIGSREIAPNKPWQNKGNGTSLKNRIIYKPSFQEIEETKKVMNFFDAELGCVDWVEVKNKGRFYLEYNGIGTSYDKCPSPINLTKLVAEKLKNKYL